MLSNNSTHDIYQWYYKVICLHHNMNFSSILLKTHSGTNKYYFKLSHELCENKGKYFKGSQLLYSLTYLE